MAGDESAAGHLVDRLRLVVITDRRLAGTRGWLDAVRGALAGGTTCIQLRDKRATGREALEMAVTLRPLIEEYDALFIVNDRADVAIAAGAHGVHLGPEDLPVAELRSAVQRDFIIGRSADTVADGAAAAAAGADYLGVGSVFGTTTKEEVVGERIGLERLAEVASAVDIPVVGIGGITPSNAESVREAGAAGIAVVSAVMGAEDPAAAARKLLG